MYYIYMLYICMCKFAAKICNYMSHALCMYVCIYNMQYISFALYMS